MQALQQVAFKEWSVICSVLGAGRQSMILRKGGIHEGRAGFRVQYGEFWLFPTNFHQAADDLAEEYLDLWQNLRGITTWGDRIPVRHYAIVERTLEVTNENDLPRLVGLHGWSDSVVQKRFCYRRPGLLVMLVRVFELPNEILLENSPHFAGCRSWVQLPQALPTAELRPVLSDETHMIRIAEIERRLTQTRIV